MVHTKNGGVRYYKNSLGERFLPLSKANFLKMDMTETPVYQKIEGIGWFQINEAYNEK